MNPPAISRQLAPAIAAATLLTPQISRADGSPDAFKSFCDDLWGYSVLYSNGDNPVIQKLAFTGRAQFDYVHIDGEGMRTGGVPDEDLHYDDFNDRRLRGGFKGQFFKDFTAHVEADFQYDEDPVYQRLTDANIAWTHSDALTIKVGKQGMEFTLDGATSSKELITIDRNNLSNNLWFTYEYIPGITASGEVGNWIYNTGVFSQGDEDKEFGDFNGGTSWLAAVGYDFKNCLGADEALLTANYVYNEPTTTGGSLFTNRSLQHIGSLNFRYQDEDFGFRADLSAADGYAGQPDLWGFVAMPYYNITDKLQVVGRYTLIDSSGDNGVRYGGYESSLVVSAKGDFYQEGYLGLNYYLYGHKLKLQTGLAYISMDDDANDGGEFDGISWQTGLRIAW
ncbi:MAG: hypothetical protein H7A50_15620 [Akkermansiaceae bacterium]|nr:hypothetical protein [Akkermansiaceae bacterium]